MEFKESLDIMSDRTLLVGKKNALILEYSVELETLSQSLIDHSNLQLVS